MNHNFLGKVTEVASLGGEESAVTITGDFGAVTFALSDDAVQSLFPMDTEVIVKLTPVDEDVGL